MTMDLKSLSVSGKLKIFLAKARLQDTLCPVGRPLLSPAAVPSCVTRRRHEGGLRSSAKSTPWTPHSLKSSPGRACPYVSPLLYENVCNLFPLVWSVRNDVQRITGMHKKVQRTYTLGLEISIWTTRSLNANCPGGHLHSIECKCGGL